MNILVMRESKKLELVVSLNSSYCGQEMKGLEENVNNYNCYSRR
jgi:hypothetical protein